MPVVVLVEGVDDLHVVRNLAAQHDVDLREVKKLSDAGSGAGIVYACGSLSRLLEDIRVCIELRGDDTALVVDADTDLASRWQSIRDTLRNLGYKPPHEPLSKGLVLGGSGLPVVGVWIMPNNSLPGALENFVQLLVPDGDDLLPLAKHAVGTIPETARRFKPQSLAKAEMHTWLAWQEEPGTPMGAAITKRYLEADSKQASMFVMWLRRLLDEASTS